MTELVKIMGIEQEKLEGLTYSQFKEASENWWAFEVMREKKHGHTLHAKWAEKHTGALKAFKDKEEMYEMWKPMELEVRQSDEDKGDD
ncbi:hypothetical protein PQX77_002767 [Marasmius sp. AFHP31]|nr:hypothetical protein PQX77_002767 [Marasmius sp. AFHP31]